jgi:hypothetical protein
MGFMTIIKTIIRLKMCTVFPAIHIIKMFIGSCLMGPLAISHAFCTMSTRAMASYLRVVSVARALDATHRLL